MKWSVVVPGTVSERMADIAAHAERAGLFRLWTTESPGRDAIVRSAHLLQHSSTLRSGTGIAFAFQRSPLATAGAAADTFALSGGRFSLGLGAGTRGQRRWYDVEFDHPAPRLADYVRAVKAVLRSTGTVRHQGPYYELSVPRVELAGDPKQRKDLKIYGGGLHEKLLRAIVRSCDGIVLHPLAGGSRYLDEVVLPLMTDTPTDTGAPPRLTVWCPTTIDEDAEVARRRATEQLAFYFSTPSYQDVAARCGFGSVAAELVERFNHSGTRPTFAELAPLVPDDMLDYFVLHGTPTRVAERLAEHATAWQRRGVAEVALQVGAQSIDADGLLANIDQLAARVPA
jgi:alkanesulfonate monooxygenase SsuD/methylene tetrahydromethanopterin reductase-like flavin-dependent oxidoreductase (luciferase family)